jgi:AcrR family transcriptional regulator
VTSTTLALQLSGQLPPSKPTALDAFKCARRTFLAGERVEMRQIAEQLGTSRVTLHRWVGSRDLLMCEVLWSIVEPALERARSGALSARGGATIAQTMELFLADLLSAPQTIAFLKREPEIALRICTTKHTDLQRRIVAFFRDQLVAEIDAGRLDPPLPIDDLAYLIVRIAESFFYSDIIASGEPDPRKAGEAIAALLR